MIEPSPGTVSELSGAGAQKRRNLRARVALPAAIDFRAAVVEHTVVGQAVDLSAGGVGVLCTEPLSVGLKVSVALQLPEDGAVVAHAVILRRTRCDDRFLHGLRFERISVRGRAAVTRAVIQALAESGDTPPEAQRDVA